MFKEIKQTNKGNLEDNIGRKWKYQKDRNYVKEPNRFWNKKYNNLMTNLLKVFNKKLEKAGERITELEDKACENRVWGTQSKNNLEKWTEPRD